MRKSIVTYASIIVCVVVLFLSIGYSAFNSRLNITGTVATVRIKKDIRVTGISVYSRTNSGVSNYEDYNVSNIQMGVSLPNSSSTVTYKVTVTNIGNTEMGIFNITGLPSNLDYEVTGYTLKTKICNTSNVCKLGITKDFYIKIKYKTFNSGTTNYGLVLNVDFQPMYTATYKDKEGVTHTSEVIGKDTYILDFGSSKPTYVDVYMGSSLLVSSCYTYINGVLTVPDVSDNITIEPIYEKDYLIKTTYDEYSSTPFLGGDTVLKAQIETITMVNSNAVPSNAKASWDASEKRNGSIMAWCLDSNNNGLYELYIGQEGGVNAHPTSSWLFYDFNNVTTININNFDISDSTTLYGLFSDCSKLTNIIGLNSIDTSNIVSIGEMFSGCSSLTSLDLRSFNTSKMRNMYSLFYLCTNLKTIDLTGWDTSSVTNMSYMFGMERTNLGNMTSKLTTIKGIENFDTSNVTTMRWMFNFCTSLTSLDLSKWNVSKVTDMEMVFNKCTGLISLNITSWNTSSATNMNEMFGYCTGLTNLDIRNFNMSKVTNYDSMFSTCTNLKTIDMRNTSINTSVTPRYSVFSSCNNLTTIYVKNTDAKTWISDQISDSRLTGVTVSIV